MEKEDSILGIMAKGIFYLAVYALIILVFIQVSRYYVNQEVNEAVASYKRELATYGKILTNPALCDQYEYKGRD